MITLNRLERSQCRAMTKKTWAFTLFNLSLHTSSTQILLYTYHSRQCLMDVKVMYFGIQVCLQNRKKSSTLFKLMDAKNLSFVYQKIQQIATIYKAFLLTLSQDKRLTRAGLPSKKILLKYPSNQMKSGTLEFISFKSNYLTSSLKNLYWNTTT